MLTILDPRAWLIGIGALAFAYAGGRFQQHHNDSAVYAAERTKAALSAANDQVHAVDRARLEEQRRTAAQSEIANAATKDAESARADARGASDAANRLRLRVAELLAASRSAKDPTPTGGSVAAPDPIGMLADVLDRADKRAGVLAAYADQARIAGQACVDSYQALTNGITLDQGKVGTQ